MQNGNGRLPWIVAAAGFVLYALTMGDGVTANSLATVARVAGWDNLPLLGQPLLWFVTLPLQLLPVALAGAGGESAGRRAGGGHPGPPRPDSATDAVGPDLGPSRGAGPWRCPC